MRISDWSSDVCSSDLDGEDILVAATRAIDDDDLVLVHLWREPFGGGDGVGGFERGDDAFEPGQLLEAGERFRVGDRFIPHAADVMQPGMRSEEHTSELQSLMRISYAVFCLQKKNIKDIGLSQL